MKRKFKIAVLMLLIFTIGCGMKTVKDEGNAFMEALKVSDVEKSFNMLDISIQREVGGMEGWANWIENRKPQNWEFATIDEKKEEGAGKILGKADFATGQNLEIELHFRIINDLWKLIAIDFKSDK